jgi:hypothetical protein
MLRLAVITDHEDDLRALALCFPDSHAGLDAEFSDLIGGGRDHCSAVRADYGNWFSPQLRICLLLDTGKEGIHVKMKNDPVVRGILSFQIWSGGLEMSPYSLSPKHMSFDSILEEVGQDGSKSVKVNFET